MALNTKFSWGDGVNDFDAQTVFLHENGHVVGLGHSLVEDSVMEAVYAGERRVLTDDDIAGITSLYPPSCGLNSDCDELDACTADTCDLTTGVGVCSNDPIVCADDGNACTTNSCDPATGFCSNDPISCDDEIGCTVDSCDSSVGCEHDDTTCPICSGDKAVCAFPEDCCSFNCIGGTCRGNLNPSEPSLCCEGRLSAT